MGKELLEMTLEELWGLFPIFLVQHDNQWNEYYNEIESTITDLLAGYVNRLMTHSWGQKVIRFYDPDGNLIEVGTPM